MGDESEYGTESRRYVVCSEGISNIDIENLSKNGWNLQCEYWHEISGMLSDLENDD